MPNFWSVATSGLEALSHPPLASPLIRWGRLEDRAGTTLGGTQAFHYAPAAAVSPFNYMALIWGSTIGSLMWREVPTRPIVIGAAIVTLTGLYLLRSETRRRRKPAAANRPAS